MSHDAIAATLRSLRLHGMVQALDELAQQGAPLYQQALPLMTTLLKAEVAEREVRSINYQLKVARFPIYRDLSHFDFTQSVVDEALIRQLHRGDFMDERQNGAAAAVVARPVRDSCQPSSCRVWQSITSASVSQPSRPPQIRHRSVAQRWFGAVATDGKAWIRGRMPIARLRTCQPLSWKMRCTVFLFMPSNPATVR